jgi:uncharacterized protein
MAMHFEGEFRVPGKASDVIRRFADVPRMARCMPGAVLQAQAEDGSWPGAMVVSFGPKKINFKGRASCEFDEQALVGSVHGRGTADMRSARIGVKVSFALSDVAGSVPSLTLVKIVSDSELGGVLEDFAKTGGIAVANAIMADFARRASEEFGRDATLAPDEAATSEGSAGIAGSGVPIAETTQSSAGVVAARVAGPASGSASVAAAPSSRLAGAAPLAVHSLLWIVIKAYWRKLLASIGLARQT